jgi:16S rRNA (guanine527-N7)-methyltransferase
MKNDIIQEWSNNRNKQLSKEVCENMLLFSRLIHESNQLFNLTGLKTQELILSELILGSIDPVRDIIVPRGTRIIDIGSGAGIPGISLAIYFKHLTGFLVESNHKKADFISSAIKKLGLLNINILCERAEIVARDKKYRETFDWCFTRAFAKHFISIELSSAFIKKNGIYYIFTNDVPGNISSDVFNHARKMGLFLLSYKECIKSGLPKAGLCFKKVKRTPDIFPRKYTVIKREMEIMRDNY